jgi:hypothetical protein
LGTRLVVEPAVRVCGDRGDRLWGVLNEKVFNYNGYQAKVGRQIAVVELTPSSA